MKQSKQYGDQINTMFKQVNEKDDKIALLVEKVKLFQTSLLYWWILFLSYIQTTFAKWQWMYNDCLLRLIVLGGTFGAKCIAQ